MASIKDLRTGFTGELDEKAGSIAEKAKSAASYVRDEAGAVAASAQDHPSATSTALLLFGAAAFLLGYLAGSASAAPQRSRYW